MKRRKDFALTAAEKADAREALSLLEGSGVTLAMAARVALRLDSGPAVDDGLLVEDLVDEFLRMKLKTVDRSRTYDFYEQKLRPFAASLDGVKASALTGRALSEWFAAQTRTAGGRDAYWRAVRAMLRWAAKQGKIATDPTQEYEGPGRAARSEVEFLSVDDARLVMAGAAHHTAAAALHLFAGLRPEEVGPQGDKPTLAWEHIDLPGKTIRVPATVAKMEVARVLESGLPANLWLWLETVDKRDRTGPVCSVLSSSMCRYLQRAAGFVGPREERLRPWPYDGLRHTFATYHVAAHNDPGLTSLLLGHEASPKMLHRHYRGLTSKQNATAFFNIVP